MTRGVILTYQTLCGVLFAVALCCVFAAPARAQDRQAYVIDNNGADPSRAIAVSQAFLGGGYDVVRRAGATPQSLDLSRGRGDTVALYYSGPVTRDAQGQITLSDWHLRDLVAAWRASGVQHQMYLIEGCLEQDALVAADLDLGPDVFVAATQSCRAPDASRFSERLQVALALSDRDLATALAQVGQRNMAGGTRLRAVQDRAPRRLPSGAARALTLLEPEVQDAISAQFTTAAIRLGAGQATVVSPLVQSPQTASGGVTILRPAVAASGVGLRTVRLVPQSGPAAAALPQVAGLPRPLIRVGRIAPQEASFTPQDQLGSLSGTTIDPGSFEARQQMRADNPAQFAALLESGAFDPPAGQIVTRLQTELQRMRCYTGRIDGDWGRGSRAAVGRYRQAASSSATGTAADIALFREIAANDTVACPVVARAATPQRTPQRATSTRRTTSSQTTRRATPQRQPAARQPTPRPAPSTNSGGLNSGNLGTGIFR